MGKQRKTKNIDLTVGNITSSLWKFAVPLMLGNVLQQLYNLVDTWVVGHYIGDNALAAVGSSYTLMTFLTSIVIGLCLGSSAFLSMAYGKKNQNLIRNGIFISAVVVRRKRSQHTIQGSGSHDAVVLAQRIHDGNCLTQLVLLV